MLVNFIFLGVGAFHISQKILIVGTEGNVHDLPQKAFFGDFNGGSRTLKVI